MVSLWNSISSTGRSPLRSSSSTAHSSSSRTSLNQSSLTIYSLINIRGYIGRCVYYCMEYMDAGSLDKLQGEGIPEDVLGRIAGSMVRGLKFLKDELQIIHRGTILYYSLTNQSGNTQMDVFYFERREAYERTRK